jgi:glycosyltransferase involved in cell wall biosynthesis
VGFVLPVYERRSGRQMAHHPRLLELLGRDLDVEVLIWKCLDEPDLPGVTTIWRLSAPGRLRRVLEMWRLVRARVRDGCRVWYVRSVLFQALVAMAAGARTILWYSGAELPAERSWLGTRVRRWLLRRIDRVACAPAFVPYLRTRYGIAAHRILTVEYGLDLRRFQPLSAAERAAAREAAGLLPDRPLLLYVHALSTGRGADHLLPVLAQCHAAGLDPLVVAIGSEGDRSATLEAYAAQHPDRLRLLGLRPNTEVAAWYGLADLFLMPSQAEGGPWVILEAMASGTPLVSTDVGCVRAWLPPEWVEALVVPVGAPETFAARTVAVLADEALRARLREAFPPRAALFSCEAAAEQYRAVFTQLASAAERRTTP